MENGFSSPRTDAFPAGLRVLVVDDDPTWLKILEKMLKKCSYEVTIRSLAIDALNLLRERRDGFDIVISDVNMPDMDGFKLLEHVGLEMDLPVIMMSVDGETSRVMKGVQHGACDYLLKPIRMKELRNIWQHVFRKRMHEVRDIESHEGLEEIQIIRNGLDQSDDGMLGGDVMSGKKRKDAHDDIESGETSSVKKARVVWTVDLHQKFVKAVDHIGFDKVGPKKILDLMNVPWLTRENVASHLQKYRLYLSRLQKDGDLKGCFGGIRSCDTFTMPQDDDVRCSDGLSGNKIIPVQNMGPEIHEGEKKSIVSVPTIEPKEPLVVEAAMGGLGHSLGALEPGVNYAAFDCTISPYSWREVPTLQYKQHLHVQDGFNQLPLLDKRSPIRNVASVSRAIDLFSRLSESNLSDSSTSEPIPATTMSMKNNNQSSCHPTDTSMKNNRGSSQIAIDNSESAQRSLVLALEDKDLKTQLLQSDDCMQNKELFDYNHLELVPETPVHVYDALRFDYENPCELMDYHVIDQGLFIA